MQKNKKEKLTEAYWDKKYPKYIEVPKNYWTSSCEGEYLYVYENTVLK